VSDEARLNAKYKESDKMKKPTFAFSGEKASAGEVGVVRLELTTSGPPDQQVSEHPDFPGVQFG